MDVFAPGVAILSAVSQKGDTGVAYKTGAQAGLQDTYSLHNNLACRRHESCAPHPSSMVHASCMVLAIYRFNLSFQHHLRHHSPRNSP